MNRIGVRELRQEASRWLSRYWKSLEVTDRGGPGAPLVPVPGSVLDGLVASGRARRGDGHLRELGPPLPLPAGARPPSEVLERLRAGER